MKLLITTQAVDTRDSNLGFFVRWIEEFAKHCEQVTVVCLRKGAYALPSNVHIIELPHANRFVRATHLIRASIRLRADYDTVFVHMNPEYIVVGGMFWKLLGKRIGLWYTHKSVNLKLRIAEFFADVIFTASKESFRLKSSKVQVMGHGIDTDFFCPNPDVKRGDWVLSVGRLMPSKHHAEAIADAHQQGDMLRIIGEGPDRGDLEEYAKALHANVEFLGGLTQLQLRDEYRKAKLLFHRSQTGSLDKVVLEALACGLPVHTHDPALKSIENEGPAYVREHHSLMKLISAILKLLTP